jgi:hypothetical protein
VAEITAQVWFQSPPPTAEAVDFHDDWYFIDVARTQDTLMLFLIQEFLASHQHRPSAERRG